MKVSLEQLYNGKETLIKKKSYLSTREYVEPFIDQMSKFTDNFICQVKLPDQMTLDNNTVDTTYNRVYIQAVLPESYWTYDNHVEAIGLVYGLDVRKPIYKLFRSGLNQACTNLCVFNPEFIVTQELLSESRLNLKPIKTLMEMTSDFETKLRRMKETFLDRGQDSIEKQLGHWCDYVMKNEYNNGITKSKLSVATCIDAYKELYVDEESKYFISKDEEPSVFNIYNAFTDFISHDKKDIMNTIEKTLLLYSMLMGV